MMIKGIGIDSVDIARFEHWQQLPHEKLKKIFSEQEIEYCLSNPIKSAERFAARFAAREASYKALAGILPKKMPFLSVCKAVAITKKNNGKPELKIDCDALFIETPLQCHVSITHTKATATSFVVLEGQSDLTKDQIRLV